MLLPKRLRTLAPAVLATMLVLLVCPRVSAGPATDRLRDFFASVNTVLADPVIQEHPLEAVPRVRRLVADFSDVAAASAAALGREWQARTRAEREEFVELFSELLERAYVGRLGGIARLTGGVGVSFLHEIPAGDEAMVVTALRARDGRDVAVEYRMANHRGRWLVRDIALDGVSTVENYRAQFTRLLRQGAYDTLVARLRAKLSEESLFFARVEPRARAAQPAADGVLAMAGPAPAVFVQAAPPPRLAELISPPKPGAAVTRVPPARVSPTARAPEPAATRAATPSPRKPVIAATRGPVALVSLAGPAPGPDATPATPPTMPEVVEPAPAAP
ncbi:MAG: ABC transporter substrate-binding protein, partial [Candidatus Rokubacteria bacterium]|nr:ABC transporter substrate-binding protein [Candidatus Rokubacteria bacterium]